MAPNNTKFDLPAATYGIIALPDGQFAVEVTVPDTGMTRVSSFPNEVAAQAWIDKNQTKRAASKGTYVPYRLRSGAKTNLN